MDCCLFVWQLYDAQQHIIPHIVLYSTGCWKLGWESWESWLNGLCLNCSVPLTKPVLGYVTFFSINTDLTVATVASNKWVSNKMYEITIAGCNVESLVMTCILSRLCQISNDNSCFDENKTRENFNKGKRLTTERPQWFERRLHPTM